ncbi:MAG: hypothetical protein ACK46Q_05640 [Hyphomonas sp.]
MEIVTPPVGSAVDAGALAEDLHIDPAELPALERLIGAATAVVETATNRPILPREVRFRLPEAPFRDVWLPCAPVIELLGAEGAQLLNGHDEPRLRRGTFAGDSVLLRVGYADPARAPQQLRQAIILLVMEWREAQISVGETFTAPALSFGVHRLLRQVRYRRPQVVC